MRKEVAIVILIGIAIGAIVAYGIYTAQSAIKKRQAPTGPAPTSQLPSPTPTAHALTIIEPADESIIEEETVQLVATTSPNAVVTIITNQNEYLLTADQDGNLSTSVQLVAGENTILVTAFDGAGNKVEATLTLVYSTQL